MGITMIAMFRQTRAMPSMIFYRLGGSHDQDSLGARYLSSAARGIETEAPSIPFFC